MSAQLLPLAELAEALVLFKRAAQQAEQHGTLTKMNAAALESLSDAAGNLLAHGRSARGTITQILRGLRPKPPWAAMYLNDSTRNALLQVRFTQSSAPPAERANRARSCGLPLQGRLSRDGPLTASPAGVCEGAGSSWDPMSSSKDIASQGATALHVHA